MSWASSSIATDIKAIDVVIDVAFLANEVLIFFGNKANSIGYNSFVTKVEKEWYMVYLWH